MRIRALLMLPALPLAFAAGASADSADLTSDTAASAAETTEAGEPDEAAQEGQDDVRVADADPQTDPAGSGDADASGPVEAETPKGQADADEEKKKADKKKADSAVEEKVTADKKKADKKAGEDDKVPAALQAGGVVGGGSSFPLSLTTSMTTSVGTGTFAPGYTNNPNIQTNLRLAPALRIPKWFEYQPAAMISGSISAQIEWMSSYTGTAFFGPRDRQLRISDAAVSLILPGVVTIPFVNVNITPIMTGRIPLSVASRFNQRLFGAGGALMAAWNYASFLGVMGLRGVVSGNYWEHLATERKLPCGETYPTGGGFFAGTGFTDGTTDFPLAVGRLEERTADGQCIVAGRQVVGSSAVTGSAFWSLPDFFGNHTFTASGGLFHLMSRPLENRPDLRSQFAQPQSFLNVSPWHSATLSYNYAVPGDWLPFSGNTQLSAGVTSTQPVYDGQGYFRLPFDFNVQGGNNFTQGFFTLTVGI